MKKIFFLIIALSISCFGHKQHVHRYLTIEGYKLLKNYFSTDIPKMKDHVDIPGSIPPAWSNHMLSTGAYREDEEDIMYSYGVPGKTRISVTHFWNADEGAIAQTIFDFGLFTDGPYPNAWQKAYKFAYPNRSWTLKYFDGNHGHTSTFNKSGGGTVNITWYDQLGFEYNSLKELYTTGKTWIVGYYDSNGQWINSNLNPNLPYAVILGEGWRDVFVWEILGRMCHLIQDMSIPAHAHIDPHGSDMEFGIKIGEDDYEKWISENGRYTSYNANNVGNLLDPYWHHNPSVDEHIFFLMYTTNQIADHFWSSGPINAVGDDYYGQHLSPQMNVDAYLNSIDFASLGEPVGSSNFTDVTCSNIASKTLPHAIRATAGLLYWFAKEANLIQPCTINITRVFEFDSPESGFIEGGLIGSPKTISTLSTIDKNGRTYSFANWSDGVTDNPRTVTPTGNMNIDADYKAHLLTSTQSATGIGSQRKIARDAYNGKLHMIYTSSEKIWHTYSTDQGSTWSNGKCISGSGTASNPSIASSGWSWGANEIYFVWQETAGSTRNLYFKSLYYSTPKLLDSGPADTDMQAVIAASDDDKVLVVYKKVYSGRYQIHYKYSLNGGSTFSVGGPLYIGPPLISNFPSLAWNPQNNKFMMSTIDTSPGYLGVDLYSFNGSTWNYEGDVYYSDQVPSTTPYTQVAVDGIGRTHITWIAYDNHYGDGSAAMYRSVLNGNWSSVSLFRDEIIYDPSIVYTSVAGHLDADGGTSLFYLPPEQSNVLHSVYSTNNTSWNGLGYITALAPISYPVLLEKALPQSVSLATVKGSASPYEIKTQTRNQSQPGYSGGILKIAGNKENDPKIGNANLYRRIEIIDTVNNGLLSIQFGNIEKKAVDFLRNDSVSLKGSSFMSTDQFKFENNDTLSVEFGIRSKEWKRTTNLVFELVEFETGKVIWKIGEYNLTTQKVWSINENKVNKVVSRIQNTTAILRVRVEGIDYKDLVVNYIETMIFSDGLNKISNDDNYNLIEIGQTPKEYQLAQNYPNPFNITTTIAYQLPMDGFVTLKIYDVIGNEITTLVNGYKTSGKYSLSFDASDLASGIYLYQIKTGDFSSTKKLVLMK